MSSAVSDTQYMDVQKIVVTLSEPDVIIEPGGTARLIVTAANRQENPDRLSIEVEGIDIEWYTIPVATVNVAPGAQAVERINFKVARASENRAGSYPFLVRVIAMESGEVGVAQAMLVVKPFDDLELGLIPRRAVATFFHPLNDFEVTVSNLSNAEETLELFASDPDDECAYEFDMERVTLKPGQSQTVLMAARPKASKWIGSARLVGFSVSARSTENSFVSAKSQGQIDKTALISPLLGIFLLLLAVSGIGYFALRPKPFVPPHIEAFNAVPMNVVEGQETKLTWSITNAGERPNIVLSHHVDKEGKEVYDNNQTNVVGNFNVKPERPVTFYTLTVRGADGKPISKEVQVAVSAAPLAPVPTLKKFDSDTSAIHAGEQVTLSWKGTGAGRFVLDPGSIPLGPLEESRIMSPTQDTVYTLRAISEDGKTQSQPKSISIRVFAPDAAIAKIDKFVAASDTVYIGDSVRLKWTTHYARSVRVENDKGEQIGGGLPVNGTTDVVVTEKTTFTLTAADSAGKLTVAQIIVDPKPRPAPPIEPTMPPVDPPVSPQDGTNPTVHP